MCFLYLKEKITTNKTASTYLVPVFFGLEKQDHVKLKGRHFRSSFINPRSTVKPDIFICFRTRKAQSNIACKLLFRQYRSPKLMTRQKQTKVWQFLLISLASSLCLSRHSGSKKTRTCKLPFFFIWFVLLYS